MTPITFTDQMIEIDATLVAQGLRTDPETLRKGLQNGSITRTVEKGEAGDEGRFRVTFYAPTCRLRLIFTAEGKIVQTSTADYSRRTRAADATPDPAPDSDSGPAPDQAPDQTPDSRPASDPDPAPGPAITR